jgi:uncharacterized membrane protein
MNLTTQQRYFLGATTVILATLAATVVAYPHLPGTVPVHWNAHGQIDGWASKWTLFLYGPGVMTLVLVLFAALPWLSPKKFEVDTFRPTYLYIMIILVAMFAYMQTLMILAALNSALDTSRAVIGGVCLLIALLGDVLGKVRRNFYVGIRTPWTLANERVWNATHRLGAKTFFAGGLVGFIAVLLRAPFWLPFAAILLAAFTPAIYSLIYYKQVERHGERSGGM